MYLRKELIRKVVSGFVFGVVLVILNLILSKTPLENIIHIRVLSPESLTYLYFWRASTSILITWFIIIIIMLIKPMTAGDAALISTGLGYVLVHYMYLNNLVDNGVNITMYPLTYTIQTIGEPIVFIDLGQVIALVTIWRFMTIFKKLKIYS